VLIRGRNVTRRGEGTRALADGKVLARSNNEAWPVGEKVERMDPAGNRAEGHDSRGGIAWS
jgi:hypothetical protein